MPLSWTLVSRSEAATLAAGRDLAGSLGAGDIILLRGDLGMGKTVFARGLAAGLGVDPDQVRSPTFTLVNPYHGRLPVYHIDLYRIEKPGDLDELGLEEILGGDGVVMVEWAERLGPYHPRRHLAVRITDRGGNERDITIEDLRDSRGATRGGSSGLPS
jgi:tRNA threonylcarbamoyladenosine biosynthesis protein TsaE